MQPRGLLGVPRRCSTPVGVTLTSPSPHWLIRVHLRASAANTFFCRHVPPDAADGAAIRTRNRPLAPLAVEAGMCASDRPKPGHDTGESASTRAGIIPILGTIDSWDDARPSVVVGSSAPLTVGAASRRPIVPTFGTNGRSTPSSPGSAASTPCRRLTDCYRGAERARFPSSRSKPATRRYSPPPGQPKVQVSGEQFAIVCSGFSYAARCVSFMEQAFSLAATEISPLSRHTGQ
jgi:hypothetical protein